MVDAMINPLILYHARRRAGMERSELAEKAAVKVEEILSWERGESEPSFEKAKKRKRIKKNRKKKTKKMKRGF